MAELETIHHEQCEIEETLHASRLGDCIVYTIERLRDAGAIGMRLFVPSWLAENGIRVLFIQAKKASGVRVLVLSKPDNWKRGTQ